MFPSPSSLLFFLPLPHLHTKTYCLNIIKMIRTLARARACVCVLIITAIEIEMTGMQGAVWAPACKWIMITIQLWKKANLLLPCKWTHRKHVHVRYIRMRKATVMLKFYVHFNAQMLDKFQLKWHTADSQTYCKHCHIPSHFFTLLGIRFLWS